MSITGPLPDVNRLRHDIETMATFIDQREAGWTRRAFAPYYLLGREWLEDQMTECGMQVKYDASSNLIGSILGSQPDLPGIMVGSHTDTVAGGGRFDGIIGVLAGLEVARTFKETRTILKHTVEVVDFTAEEPGEFGISTVGSRGMAGKLTDEMLHRKDRDGNTLKDRLRMVGGDPGQISVCARKKGDIALYLELHIEQGPILEETSNKLGVVTGIVGIHRYCVTVEGMPNHAGSTPMSSRCDALAAASQMILVLESICKEKHREPVVGTVGTLKVEPNAVNVIPGKVVFELEIRCLDPEITERIMEKFTCEVKEISKNRKIIVQIDCLSKSEAIKVDQKVIDVIEKTCRNLADCIRLPSGAGHDANHLALLAPIGMIFVPSLRGRSHCPEEWTSYEDIATGVKALVDCLITFDAIF